MTDVTAITAITTTGAQRTHLRWLRGLARLRSGRRRAAVEAYAAAVRAYIAAERAGADTRTLCALWDACGRTRPASAVADA